MFFAELVIILFCILIGIRIGGIGLGTFSTLGLLLLTFLFGVSPTSPPITVILMVFAVITAVNIMQASGGLDFMVWIAETVLRKKPEYITFIAPCVAYVFTLITGTGHIIYALLPVIVDISKEAKVRPERPLSVSVIASQQAITASPISAATISLLALLSIYNITLSTILIICIPSTIIGFLFAAIVVNNIGLDLDKDPIYLKKLKNGTIFTNKNKKKPVYKLFDKAPMSICLFFIGIILIIILGSNENLRPYWIISDTYSSMKMSSLIEIIMLSIGALILTLKIDKDKVENGSVSRAGFIAIISIFGIAWLGDTFVSSNSIIIHKYIGKVVISYPYLFAFSLFFLSMLLYSQAATILSLIPLGLALKIPPLYLIAMFPAVNGYFFLPTYGTMLAAIAFDSTGSTKVGKYILNHSFMLPGLIATTSSVSVGFIISFFL